MGNLLLEQVVNIARMMRPRSIAKKLDGTVKEILGEGLELFFRWSKFSKYYRYIQKIKNSVSIFNSFKAVQIIDVGTIVQGMRD